MSLPVGWVRGLPCIVLLLACESLAAQQTPRFVAAVNAVKVDVVVTDRDGAFVDDLHAEDFVLFENGERQEIVSVDLVDLAARDVRRIEMVDGAGPELLPGITSGEPAGDLGAVIVLIDLQGLYFENSITFAESMTRVLEKMDRISLPHAIYMTDMAGGLRELQPLTVDLDALRQAAGELRGTPASVSRFNLFHRGALDRDVGPWTRIAKAEERARTIHTYELLRDFVDSLAHRAGRTALVWVSTGVDLAAYETIERPYSVTGEVNPTPSAKFRSYSPDLQILSLQDGLHRAANTANVSIYSVDPSKLHEFYLTETGFTERKGSAADARGNSLRHAAEETGGEVFIGWTDLDRVLENIERDAGRFYLLTYLVPQEGEEEKYNEIRVEVTRPDVSVRARKGYIRYSEEVRRSRVVRGALSLPGSVSGFHIDVQGIRAREVGGQALLVVDTAIDASLATPEGPRETLEPGSLLVYATVRDSEGSLLATVEGGRLTPAGGTGARSVTNERPAQSYWTHRNVFRLEAGDYDVGVVVMDPSSERIGAASLEMEILDAAGSWDVSDPWLAVRGDGDSVSALVAGQVPVGQAVFAYLEVYNGSAPSVSGRILTATETDTVVAGDEGDDAAAAERRAGPAALEVLPMELLEDGGLHRGNVMLPGLSPGRYVLELQILDSGVGQERTVRLPLRVVPPR